MFYSHGSGSWSSFVLRSQLGAGAGAHHEILFVGGANPNRARKVSARGEGAPGVNANRSASPVGRRRTLCRLGIGRK